MGERKVHQTLIRRRFLGFANQRISRRRFDICFRFVFDVANMSEGIKFNCREEEVIGETYVGIKIHRFYFKCTNCCAELISVSVDSMLEALSRRNEEEEEEEEVAKEEDAVLIKSIRFGKQRKILEEEEADEKSKRRMEPRDEKKPKPKKLACIMTLKKRTSLGLTSLCHNFGTDEED